VSAFFDPKDRYAGGLEAELARLRADLTATRQRAEAAEWERDEARQQLGEVRAEFQAFSLNANEQYELLAEKYWAAHQEARKAKEGDRA
jgi:uncharacterized protein (DUF3084 family)